MTIASSSSSSGLTRPLDQTARRDEFAGKLFNRIDGDRDGQVTEAEFTEAMNQRFGSTTESGRPDPAEVFRSMDADEDGSINLGEFKSALESMRPPAGAGGPPLMGGKPPAGGPPPLLEPAAQAEEVFAAADTNKDGTISVEELLASLQSDSEDGTATSVDEATRQRIEDFFAEVDADRDGGISQAELTTVFEQLRAQAESARASAVGYAADGSTASTASAGQTLSTYV